MIYADLIAKVMLVTLVTLDKNRSFTILGSNILSEIGVRNTIGISANDH